MKRKPVRKTDVSATLRCRDDQGFTLIELVIGVVVTALIVGAAFAVLVTTEKATRANDQVVDTQQSARLAMDLIARDIKLAGFGMVGTVGNCSIGGNAAAIVPLDQTIGGADRGADSIRLAVPITSTVAPTWTLTSGVGGTSAITQFNLPAGAVANMQTEAGGSLTGVALSLAGAFTATVTGASGTTININTIPPPVAFAAGTPVYLLECVTYRVDTTTTGPCGTNAPCLLRNGVNIAEGIEDIQFEYACDGCVSAVNAGVAEGIIDNQNAVSGFDAGDFVMNTDWATAPLTPSTIRLVRIFIVARQNKADHGFGERVSAGVETAGPLQISDHNHSADAGYNATTYSQFRRRILTRTVEARNLGL